MFFHVESISCDLSFQPDISELGERSVHQGAAAMVVVEDLEGIVTKLAWLAEVRSRAWVGMEFLFVDGSDHPLCSQDTGVVPVQLIPNPSTSVNGVIIRLVGDSNGVVLHWVVFEPAQVPHYSCFSLLVAETVVSPRRVPKISSRASTTRRSGCFDPGDFDVSSNRSFFFFSFFLLRITFSFCESCQFFFTCLEGIV